MEESPKDFVPDLAQGAGEGGAGHSSSMEGNFLQEPAATILWLLIWGCLKLGCHLAFNQDPRIKVMRKRPKMSAKGVSGLLACTMELFIFYKIEVVSAPMVRTEQRYRAFSDGLLDWYFRLVGHQVWREIQIADKICQIFQKYYNSTCSSWKWWKRCQSCALNNTRSHDFQKWR